MKNIDICCGEYASKYALTDWYEGSEEILREAMASGEDFDTDWFGCRKEIRYARIVRENGLYTVEVSSHCDDLWDGDDLIYDALWEVSNSEKELPDDIIDSIRDAALDCGIDDSADEAESLPDTATFEEISKLIGKLEVITEAQVHDGYRRLCEIVKEHVEYMQTPEYQNMKGEHNED